MDLMPNTTRDRTSPRLLVSSSPPSGVRRETRVIPRQRGNQVKQRRDIKFNQAPPSRFAYSSSIASSYNRSASISASVFSRVVPAPVFTPAPVGIELELPVCDCSCRDESMSGSEPDVGAKGCDDGAVEGAREGIVEFEVIGYAVKLSIL